MKYLLRIENSHRHFLQISCTIERISEAKINIQLPSWRPGRYELGNFAKNLRNFKATSSDGKVLSHKKLSKDLWEIETAGEKTIEVSYLYYASELNAGSSFLNDQLLYVNPVNCFVFQVDKHNEPCEVQLEIPDSYQIACSLEKDGKTLKASSFDELADSPFIASADLKKYSFHIDKSEIFLWFNGDFEADMDKVTADCKAYCTEQINMMGEMPHHEFHFLYHILPFKFYHGVEHSNSTVCVLGPASDFEKPSLYQEFLGVSSHEFFHLWNIKRIRPVEMFPYDLTRENYSRSGYVYEGLTTYYGDVFLLRSKVFSWDQYCVELDKFINKHFDNAGRYNLSVADSSYDTWLDGYVPGIPDRKVSIYTEGLLAAMILDMLIRKNTGNEHSLDHVIRTLYYEYAKKGKGYSEEDYKNVAEKVAGTSLDWYFKDLINGCGHIEKHLENALNYIGCKLYTLPNPHLFEENFGFKANKENHKYVVKSVIENSVADKAGLGIDDVIAGINSEPLLPEDNLQDRFSKLEKTDCNLQILRLHRSVAIHLNTGREKYFPQYHVEKMDNADENQKQAFNAWAKNDF